MSIAFLLAAQLACAPPSDAERFADARAAEGFEAGWAACAPIVEAETRADCAQSVAVRFGVFDRCGELSTDVWRDECFFSAA